jgi:mannitol/fructose-specific phosphotransferase system IIA component (Ntr-type)
VQARISDFAAADRLPVQVFVALLSPIHGGRHLQAIASIARDLADSTFRRRLLEAASGDAAFRILAGASAIARH